MPANDWGIAMLLPARVALLSLLCSCSLARPAWAQDCPVVCEGDVCHADCASTTTIVDPPQEPTIDLPVEDDSCEHAFNDACDDPSYSNATTSDCPTGTDHTDCAGGDE
jgi:hypothetical protein